MQKKIAYNSNIIHRAAGSQHHGNHHRHESSALAMMVFDGKPGE